MSLMVEKLAYLKKLCRLTTEQIARLSGIPVGTLNKIFSGQTKHPAAEQMERISQVFRVSTHYLLDNELPTECCFTARLEEGLFSLSAEEARFITQYRRMDAASQRVLSAMAALLRLPAGLLAGSVPTRRTFCCAISGEADASGQSMRPILLLENDPAVLQADFTVLLGDGSMEPIYPAGSVLLCRRTPAGREDYGLYRLNQVLMVRRLIRRRGIVRLTAPNLEFRDTLVADSDSLDCLGVITGQARCYRWG